MQYQSKTEIRGVAVTFIWRVCPDTEGADKKVTFVQYQVDEVSPDAFRDEIEQITADIVNIPYTHGQGMTEGRFLMILNQRCGARQCSLDYAS